MDPDIRRRVTVLFGISAAIFGIAALLGYVTVDGSTVSGGSSAMSLGLANIFVNNTVVFSLILLGGATFGISGIFFLFTTSAALGAGIRTAVLAGFDAPTIVLLVVPHAILELPAFFIAAAIGFDVAWRITSYLRGVRSKPMCRERAWEYATVVVIGYVALALAAVIESTVTRQIANSVS
ncbi:hypothetical protein BRD17_05285 [Halobacteriales archaeon SW_7_68_16]|nr:MAG: hypothetical protein BRD17_05285 [Halobacteriales archaeon SW_7_68_16]